MNGDSRVFFSGDQEQVYPISDKVKDYFTKGGKYEKCIISFLKEFPPDRFYFETDVTQRMHLDALSLSAAFAGATSNESSDVEADVGESSESTQAKEKEPTTSEENKICDVGGADEAVETETVDGKTRLRSRAHVRVLTSSRIRSATPPARASQSKDSKKTEKTYVATSILPERLSQYNAPSRQKQIPQKL